MALKIFLKFHILLAVIFVVSKFIYEWLKLLTSILTFLFLYKKINHLHNLKVSVKHILPCWR